MIVLNGVMQSAKIGSVGESRERMDGLVKNICITFTSAIIMLVLLHRHTKKILKYFKLLNCLAFR